MTIDFTNFGFMVFKNYKLIKITETDPDNQGM